MENFLEQLPSAVQETESSLHRPVVPLGVPLGRTDEQGIKPVGIGAVFRDELVGLDRISLALGDLDAALGDHTLGEKAGKGLVEINASQVFQHLGNEAGIKQMEDGMFHSPDILVHRE